jgi:hypothetical protein
MEALLYAQNHREMKGHLVHVGSIILLLFIYIPHKAHTYFSLAHSIVIVSQLSATRSELVIFNFLLLPDINRPQGGWRPLRAYVREKIKLYGARGYRGGGHILAEWDHWPR